MKPVLLTLFSDASFCPKTRAAGWGAWAMRDGWESGRFMGGPLRADLTTPNSAELLGITKAIQTLSAAGDLDGVDALIVQCDSVVALGVIFSGVERALPAKQKASNDVRWIQRVSPTKWNTPDREAVETLRQLIGARTIWLRHVRGHQSSATGRSWVNEQCDSEARRHMNAERQLRGR